MEAPGWKHQLAVASLAGLLAGSVVRFLIPGFLSTPGITTGANFSLALAVALFAFFLPFLWWRSVIGYLAAIILGIITVLGEVMFAASIAAAGALSTEISTVIISTSIFALLLIGGSVLAWRER